MDDKETNVFRVHIRGSIEQVWREITKTDEAQQAMFNSVMHTRGLKPGAPFRMRTVDGKYTNVVGEILEVDPPHRFAHTMRFTNYDDPPCRITYDLKPVTDGVEIHLDHRRPASRDQVGKAIAIWRKVHYKHAKSHRREWPARVGSTPPLPALQSARNLRSRQDPFGELATVTGRGPGTPGGSIFQRLGRAPGIPGSSG